MSENSQNNEQAGNKQNQQQQNQQQNQQQTNETFDSWMEKQDEKTKKLYQEHTTGLQNAIKATRRERDDLATQIKDLLPKAEKGSELEKQIIALTKQVEQTSQRAAFAEEAIKPEIGCINVKAAFALATLDGLFDRKGNPDWNEIKQVAPELFRKAGAKGNAGSGTEGEPAPAKNMNKFIRKASGRE